MFTLHMPGGRDYCEVEEDFFPSSEFKVIDKVRYHLPDGDQGTKHRPIRTTSGLSGLGFDVIDAGPVFGVHELPDDADE